MSLNFKKAFYTLEWQFVKKVLEIFNFGKNVKKWVRMFYANMESAVMNNGFAINWFKPTRGVRQGCPLSPYKRQSTFIKKNRGGSEKNRLSQRS